MKTIKCPKCKSTFQPSKTKQDFIRCQSCGSRLSVFSPLLVGPFLLLVAFPLGFGLGPMFVDVVGGLLQSPLGIEVERQQLNFINDVGKYVGVICFLGGIALILWSIVLRVVRGTFLYVKILE